MRATFRKQRKRKFNYKDLEEVLPLTLWKGYTRKDI